MLKDIAARLRLKKNILNGKKLREFFSRNGDELIDPKKEKNDSIQCKINVKTKHRKMKMGRRKKLMRSRLGNSNFEGKKFGRSKKSNLRLNFD